MAESAETYTRPEGMSDKQEEIIQYVAKYVVASCDSAKYQKKLKAKTKYNSYFDFLNAKDRYHPHYTYLVQSYRYWMEQAKAMEQNNLMSGVTEEEEQQAMSMGGGQTEYAAFQHPGMQGHAGFQDYSPYQSYGNDFGADPTAPPSASAPAVDVHAPSGSSYQHTSQASYYSGAQGSYAPQEAGSASGYGGNEYTTTVNPAAGSAVAEDDDEEYEMVMQNGVQTLVPKRR